ncbi:metal-dependent transcriptional regulator [Desertihabitans aurantiacus]|uniref:metal-dependent transcriptional regulator n=1 Tax=Desertihabitans aurantiacus TaxID=2282477 RepID=UPI000DF80DD9|nr:metal-dependent transcriptional regulator [Desertihabitans aurantiacus]
MSVSELSASAQNYLKAIWTLSEWSEAPVTTTVLAERTGLRASSVSDGIRRLAEQGLVDHVRYGAVELTVEGRRLALAMVRRHRLIEAFLVESLHYSWDEVHDEAETLEHAVSDLMVDRIDAVLGFPRRDPHGDPIPSADGTVELPTAVVLTTVEPGSRMRVERISDADPGLLQFLADRGVQIGTVVDVREPAPYTGTLELTVDGTPLSLGPAAAEAIWVSDA